MSICHSITQMICRYGDTIILTRGDTSTSSKAIIQPLMYKNKMYLGSDVLPSGYLDNGHYLMIAPAEIHTADFRDLIITDNSVKYTVKRSELVRAGDKDLYVWAVLTLYGEEAEDEYGDE